MELLYREEAISKIKGREPYILYVFTPMCGTCQVAEKMLGVVEELKLEIPLGITDINYIPEIAKEIGIESVPCLLFIKKGIIQKKIYAFKSVPDLFIEIQLFMN